MNIDSPLAIRPDTHLVFPQRRAIATFHIAEYRLGHSAIFPISMSTETGIFHGISLEVPYKETPLTRMNTEIYQKAIIRIISVLITISLSRLCFLPQTLLYFSRNRIRRGCRTFAYATIPAPKAIRTNDIKTDLFIKLA